MNPFLKSKLVFGALALVASGCSGSSLSDPREGAPLHTLEQAVTQATDAPPSQALLNDINGVLVERQSVPQFHPELLPAQFDPNIKVVALSDIWVTFVKENAGFRNSLGYFTYPEGSPPSSISLASKQAGIIFPNSSASGSGGSLVAGNRMLLGRFPAGTRVGFFLIADGCPATGCTASTLNYSKPTYYTIDAMNPETAAENRRHVVLVNHQAERKHVLAFEDINRNPGAGSDHDFDDTVFVVSYNPVDGIEPGGPGIYPLASCQAYKSQNPSAPSGIYRLDPRGTKDSTKYADFYCDMDTAGGGWTVAGCQPASATTTMGTVDRGIVGHATNAWSKALYGIPFTTVMVRNKTYNQHFTQGVADGFWQWTTNTPMSVSYNRGRGNAPAFVQGTYGDFGQPLEMMGCVNFNFDGSSSSDWGCATDPDFGGTAQGHIADYALFNCRPYFDDYTNLKWAWANNASCSYVNQDYNWCIAIR
jgi:hypothetical protein